jgi:hypothetical protein
MNVPRLRVKPMSEEQPILEKIEIRIGSSTVKGEVCTTPTTIQILAWINRHRCYSLFVKWVALPYPLSSKYAVYAEYAIHNLLDEDEFNESVENEMHIARERVTPTHVKKWLEAWLSVFAIERIAV